jgi:hypothetical protein
MSVTESAFYVARLLDAAGVSRPFVNASAATKAGLGRQAGAWAPLLREARGFPDMSVALTVLRVRPEQQSRHGISRPSAQCTIPQRQRPSSRFQWSRRFAQSWQ